MGDVNDKHVMRFSFFFLSSRLNSHEEETNTQMSPIKYLRFMNF